MIEVIRESAEIRKKSIELNNFIVKNPNSDFMLFGNEIRRMENFKKPVDSYNVKSHISNTDFNANIRNINNTVAYSNMHMNRVNANIFGYANNKNLCNENKEVMISNDNSNATADHKNNSSWMSKIKRLFSQE